MSTASVQIQSTFLGQQFQSKIGNVNYGVYIKTKIEMLMNEMQIMKKILVLQRNSVCGIWNCASGFPRGMFSLSSPITVTLMEEKKKRFTLRHWQWGYRRIKTYPKSLWGLISMDLAPSGWEVQKLSGAKAEPQLPLPVAFSTVGCLTIGQDSKGGADRRQHYYPIWNIFNRVWGNQ